MAMDDVALRQQFKINAMHGHDVGVWVCEGSGLSLSPVLFMQALCPEPAPRTLLVKWKPATVPPRAFRKNGALPLIYSECGRIPAWPYHLHLFASQAPVAQTMTRTSGLQDWSWAVPMIGIVLIFDQKYDRPPGIMSLSRLIDRSPVPPLNAPLAWVQEQHVPYVIAALGYDEATTSVEQFRNQHNLAADVAIVSGPPLVDARRRNAQSQDNGLLSSVFERQHLVVDREYAQAIMTGLLKQIEREQ